MKESLPLFPSFFFNPSLYVFLVVLPPEKAEGCESYLQYLHSEDGERVVLRDTNKGPGKKRISLDVRLSSSSPCSPHLSFCLVELWVAYYAVCWQYFSFSDFFCWFPFNLTGLH